MKIGNLEIKGKALLAPMCDVTTLPFRVICKRYGAAVVYTEMVFADAYVHDSLKTYKRVKFLEEERPFGVQIVGSSIEMLKEAAIRIEKEIKPDLIDINFGCPAYNVIKTGSGSAILKDKKKLHEIVSTLSNSLSVPLTCKMRILPKDKDTIEAAKTIQEAGAKALTVHGRTARQQYSGKANWKIIAKIKKELSIPVILNGDVVDEISTKKALDESGCDAVMIGRAAMANPHIFSRVNNYLDDGEHIPEETFTAKIAIFFEVAELCMRYGFDDVISMKMLARNMTKGFSGSREIRKKINEAKTVRNLIEVMRSFANAVNKK